MSENVWVIRVRKGHGDPMQGSDIRDHQQREAGSARGIRRMSCNCPWKSKFEVWWIWRVQASSTPWQPRRRHGLPWRATSVSVASYLKLAAGHPPRRSAIRIPPMPDTLTTATATSMLPVMGWKRRPWTARRMQRPSVRRAKRTPRSSRRTRRRRRSHRTVTTRWSWWPFGKAPTNGSPWTASTNT